MIVFTAFIILSHLFILLMGGMTRSELLVFIDRCLKNIINVGHTVASSSGSQTSFTFAPKTK